MTMLENANRALAETGTRSRLSVIDGSTTEGLYLGLLYPMLRDMMLRQGDYDWAMTQQGTVPVVIAGISWPFGYEYPADCVRIRQAVPLISSTDDPRPAEWNIFFNNFGRIVVSKAELVSFIFTTNVCPEDIWDSQFTDAFIRLLSSALQMALVNRLEASEQVLKEALAFAGIANMRDD